MARSKARRDVSTYEAIEDAAVLAAIDKMESLLEDAGRIAETWSDGSALDGNEETSFVLDDDEAIFYSFISGHMLEGDAKARVGDEEYIVMDGVAWHESEDGLTLSPAFLMSDLAETEDGGLAPRRRFDEMGFLEDSDMEAVGTLWRIHYADKAGNIAASPCFAVCPAEALSCVPRAKRAGFLESIGSPWASLEPLRPREDSDPLACLR